MSTPGSVDPNGWRRTEQHALVLDIESKLDQYIITKDRAVVYAKLVTLFLRMKVLADANPIRGMDIHDGVTVLFQRQIISPLKVFTEAKPDTQSAEFDYLCQQVFEICARKVFADKVNPCA